MTDQAAGPGPATRGSALGLRLALAFITVALAAVALLAGLTAAFAAADVSTLAGQQRAELAARSRPPPGRHGKGTAPGLPPTFPRSWTWPPGPARPSRYATRPAR